MPSWNEDFRYIDDGWVNSFPAVTNQAEWSDPVDPIYLDHHNFNSGWYSNPNGSYLFSVDDCGAHALSVLSQIQEYKKHGKKRKFSYLWIYGNRDTESEGITIRGGCDKLVSDGVPEYELAQPLLSSYSQLPYLSTTSPTGLGTAKQAVTNRYSQLISNANKYRPHMWDYYAPELTTNENIMSAIKTEGSVLIQFDTTASFNYPPSDGIIPADDPDESVTGNHVMNLIGWTEKNGSPHWVVHNSWGYWGDKDNNVGRCYIPFDYPRITLYVYVYIDRYTSTFSWDAPKVSTQDFNLSADEWNKFTDMLATYRLINNLSVQEFTIAKSGNDFSAEMFNQAINGFSGLSYSGTIPTLKNTGDDIYASYLNDLRDCLNTVDY